MFCLKKLFASATVEALSTQRDSILRPGRTNNTIGEGQIAALAMAVQLQRHDHG